MVPTKLAVLKGHHSKGSECSAAQWIECCVFSEAVTGPTPRQ